MGNRRKGLSFTEVWIDETNLAADGTVTKVRALSDQELAAELAKLAPTTPRLSDPVEACAAVRRAAGQDVIVVHGRRWGLHASGLAGPW